MLMPDAALASQVVLVFSLKSYCGKHLGIIRVSTSEGHASLEVLPLQ
jgi:hypothetical protein